MLRGTGQLRDAPCPSLCCRGHSGRGGLRGVVGLGEEGGVRGIWGGGLRRLAAIPSGWLETFGAPMTEVMGFVPCPLQGRRRLH